MIIIRWVFLGIGIVIVIVAIVELGKSNRGLV